MPTLVRRLTAFVLLAGLLVSLTGCLLVGDVTEAWAGARPDARLIGGWAEVKPRHEYNRRWLEFTADDEGKNQRLVRYFMNRSVDEAKQHAARARSITIDGHHFLIARPGKQAQGPGQSEPSKMGVESRYEITGGVLIFYSLKSAVLAKAIKAGEVAGEAPNDEVDMNVPSLKALDKPTLAWLGKVAGDGDAWEPVMRLRRETDVEAVVKKARAYPATDKTAEHATVIIDQPDLAFFLKKSNRALLERHLASSPQWRVEGRGDDWMARPREAGAVFSEHGEPSITDRELYGLHGPPQHCWQAMFRFLDKPDGARGDTEQGFTRAAPDAGPTRLNLHLNRWQKAIESHLAVGGRGLWYEFFEHSQNEDRVMTRDALKKLADFLHKLRGHVDTLRRLGYAPSLIGKDGIHHGKPTLKVLDGRLPGALDVLAWVNPGEAGRVYLQAFNADTGDRLSAGSMIERTGWSDDADELFFANSNVTVYGDEGDHPYLARFELWFVPRDGGTERKLVETTRTINGWQR